MRMLLVEDEKKVSDLVARALRAERYAVDVAADGLKGLELAEARYKVGSSSIVELSQAQLALTAAQIDETAARYEVLIRASDLNYQIGAVAEAGAPPAS